MDREGEEGKRRVSLYKNFNWKQKEITTVINSQINFKALSEIHGQNMVRKYNNMMDEDLAELGIFS